MLDNGLEYELQAQVITTGGTRTDNADGTVTVAGADSAVLVMSSGTDYSDVYPTYRAKDPHAGVTSRVDAEGAACRRSPTPPWRSDYHVPG